AAHPFCPLPGCGWGFSYQGVDAVEVWNGPWGPDDEAALGAWDRLLARAGPGRVLPALGGSDAHGPGDQVGLPYTVVLAGGLDRRAVLDGLAAGRCWLAGSAAVDLRLEAAAAGRSAGVGGGLAVPAGQGGAGRRCCVPGWAGVALRLEAAAAGRSAGIGERLAVPAGQEVAVRLQVRGGAGCLARLRGPGGAGPRAAPRPAPRPPRPSRPASAKATAGRSSGRPPPPPAPGLGPRSAASRPPGPRRGPCSPSPTRCGSARPAPSGRPPA